MKKFISLIGIISLLFTMSVFAGSIPEDLLSNDNARLYIGKVDGRTTLAEGTLPYKQNEVIYIDITPVHKYKGDVKIGVSERHTKHDFGTFIPEKDKEYLFAYIDENNFYIYDIKAWDETSIKLVDSDKYDMVKRLENYLNEGAFSMAEQERSTIGNQISFIEFLYTNPSFSSLAVEKVRLRYQDELHEVDKDKFFRIAEDIMITNVKNDTLYDVRANPDSTDAYKTVLYVELLDVNDKHVYYGAVSRFGEVDRYGLFMGRLMAKDYEMKPEDLLNLYSLLPADVQKEMIKPEILPESVGSFPLELPDEPAKDYKGIVISGAIILFAIAFFIGCKVFRKNEI